MSHMLLMRHKYIDMEYNKLEDHIANVLHQDRAEIDIEAFIQNLHPKLKKIVLKKVPKVLYMLKITEDLSILMIQKIKSPIHI